MACRIPSPTPLEWVTVQTTVPRTPFPSYDVRQRFQSDRLQLRGLYETDVESLAKLRSQPEVMKWTGQGCPDENSTATSRHLATMLPPNDVSMFNFAICTKTTGEFIGIGGCHKMDGELGWPVLGYMFRSEHWGKGYATEFVTCFLDAWWQLPRTETELQVDKTTVDYISPGKGRECLIAVTTEDNTASQHVLQKCALKIVKSWTEPDLRDKTTDILLLGFATTSTTKLD